MQAAKEGGSDQCEAQVNLKAKGGSKQLCGTICAMTLHAWCMGACFGKLVMISGLQLLAPTVHRHVSITT